MAGELLLRFWDAERLMLQRPEAWEVRSWPDWRPLATGAGTAVANPVVTGSPSPHQTAPSGLRGRPRLACRRPLAGRPALPGAAAAWWLPPEPPPGLAIPIR
jgi:hypothetical protein